MMFCFGVDVMIEFIHDKSGLKPTGFEMYEYVQYPTHIDQDLQALLL